MPAKKPAPKTSRSSKPLAKDAPPKKGPGPGKRPVPKRVKLRPKPTIWLRWCTPSDFDQLRTFYFDSLMDSPEYIVHPELSAGVRTDPAGWRDRLMATVLRTLQEGFDPKRVVKAALLLRERHGAADPEVLGMFRVEVHPATRTATILDLLVAKPHRRQGYGTMLANGILEQLQALNCIEVSLSVPYGNEEATQFFQRLGLRPYTVLWAKDIPPPPPVEVRVVARQEVGGYGGRAED